MKTMSFKAVTLPGLTLLFPSAGRAKSVFFIEAEDFDYAGGQHPPETDAMPYYEVHSSTSAVWRSEASISTGAILGSTTIIGTGSFRMCRFL